MEQDLYVSILYANKYEQIYYNHVDSLLFNTGVSASSILSQQEFLLWEKLLNGIKCELSQYKAEQPQFNKISKGILINFFAKHSSYYTNLQTEPVVIREVSYTAPLYMERLIGYFEWLDKSQYSLIEVKDKIVRYNNRERKHVLVEKDPELNLALNSLYKSYMKLLEQHVVLSKSLILDILYRVYKTLPAPSVPYISSDVTR